MTPPKREPIDMSPAAMKARLDEVAALYKLMVHLGQAKLLGPVATIGPPKPR